MDELIELVIEEAYKLRSNATKEELSLLNFSLLAPKITTRCIYGQMAGHCYSKRAIELLGSCAKPYSQELDRYRPNVKTDFSEDIFRSFSAIEFYISLKEAKNDTLISFLKGERSDLLINDLI